MDQLLARFLGPVVIVSGALTVWSLWERAWAAAPLAIVFVTAAFFWTIGRPATFGTTSGNDGPHPRCAGCAAGCVECRERIDLGHAA